MHYFGIKQLKAMNTNFQETKLLQLKKRIKQSSEMSINKSVNKQSSGIINDNGGTWKCYRIERSGISRKFIFFADSDCIYA